MLHLFSAREDLLRYGQEHYRPHSKETSSLLLKLLQAYSEEPDMPDKLKEFVRETIDELLKSLPAEELRKRLSPEERITEILSRYESNSAVHRAVQSSAPRLLEQCREVTAALRASERG